jgi:NTE family protein
MVVSPEFLDATPQAIDVLPRKQLRRPRIGLVLSGGGARGMAQIGVLKALVRHGVPIDFISGTSMGAIIGGLYASGWTIAEIESIALHTDWDEVLSLVEDTRRTELFPDQRVAVDRSFLVVRFRGFQPVIPPAVSSGQRLTTMLSTLTLQSLYHPNPSFDDLKTPFRAVATDLVSGKRIVLSEGSLAEALRATTTVPLLFTPIEKEGMQLVDGGLVTNIPVDVAKDAGCDMVIAVDATSGLRRADEMKTPWETADQIMGIMMQLSNEEQLELADIVITPDVGRHLSSNFSGIDSLVRLGGETAEGEIPNILALYEQKRIELLGLQEGDPAPVFPSGDVSFSGAWAPDSLMEHIRAEARTCGITLEDVKDHVNLLYAQGDFQDVEAEIIWDSVSTHVHYRLAPNPLLRSVRIQDGQSIPVELLEEPFLPLRDRPLNNGSARSALESVLRMYREQGYSLARIDTLDFDREQGVLTAVVNEGSIERIDVEGETRTKDWYILREFPLEEGDVFDIERAREGISNLNGTTLFEYVYLEVAYRNRRPLLTLRVKERPSQLMRFGLRADNERNLQGSVEYSDVNWRGAGMQIGVNVTGGSRNLDLIGQFSVRRLFDTYLTIGLRAFAGFRDNYLYTQNPRPDENRWDLEQVGEYREQRYGADLTFGSQLERLGNAFVRYGLQDVRIIDRRNTPQLEDRYRLSVVTVGTVIDSKNSYPFPTEGIGLDVSYEIASERLGTTPGVGYNALRLKYEDYLPMGTRFAFHPILTLGFADKTMPLGEQFRLGGRDMFFGTREDERRGRQLLLLNLEFRYMLPFRILFDSYLRLRYDLGTISKVPEEIKFNTLRHGIGLELAIDTPIGPAYASVGQAFFFNKDLPENPLQLGPLLFYFQIGYEL